MFRRHIVVYFIKFKMKTENSMRSQYHTASRVFDLEVTQPIRTAIIYLPIIILTIPCAPI